MRHFRIAIFLASALTACAGLGSKRIPADANTAPELLTSPRVGAKDATDESREQLKRKTSRNGITFIVIPVTPTRDNHQKNTCFDLTLNSEERRGQALASIIRWRFYATDTFGGIQKASPTSTMPSAPVFISQGQRFWTTTERICTGLPLNTERGMALYFDELGRSRPDEFTHVSWSVKGQARPERTSAEILSWRKK